MKISGLYVLFVFFFESRVMALQVHGIGCVWKTPLHKSGHKYNFHCGLTLFNEQ